MRILVLQLARFGDILQTWPTLKALKRTRPGAEIHVLVRSRFREPLDDFQGITVHELPTPHLLEPLYVNGDVEEGAHRVHEFASGLKGPWDQIINLSFSPVSSFLTDLFSGPQTDVRGYTRHSDGFLAIPDDSSAYFYAQVGYTKPNRYHLCDIFAAVAGVDLKEEDYSHPAQTTQSKRGIIVHLGASRRERIYPVQHWVDVLSEVIKHTEEEITLVGSSSERELAETIVTKMQSPQVINLVGASSWSQLASWIADSKLLVGGDSSPAQMASLLGVPVLALMPTTVNFWETGPTSAGSRVLLADEIHQIPAESVSAEILAILQGSQPVGPCAIRNERLGTFDLHELEIDPFCWQLIQALYTASPYPLLKDRKEALAFVRLHELAELALQQILTLREDPTNKTAADIFGSIDVMLKQISDLDPRTEPIVEWFQTQRLRLPPAKIEETLESTLRLFEELLWVSAVYCPQESFDEISTRALQLSAQCVPSLREFEFAKVQEPFQELITTIQQMARHSTKVGEQPWSSVLNEIHSALDRRDLIELADLLEHELPSALRET